MALFINFTNPHILAKRQGPPPSHAAPLRGGVYLFKNLFSVVLQFMILCTEQYDCLRTVRIASQCVLVGGSLRMLGVELGLVILIMVQNYRFPSSMLAEFQPEKKGGPLWVKTCVGHD